MSINFNGLEISTLRRNGVDAAQAYYMGHELLFNMPSTPEEWMLNYKALKTAANDLSAKGTASKYYDVFYDFMIHDTTFPVQLRNVNSWTSVAADKVMNCRIVGINFKDKGDGSGKAGLTFMAKRAHPKGSTMNSKNVSTGGYPSMALRTYLNSGVFWKSLPADLQSVIVQVKNQSYGPNKYNVTSKDKLWLPSWYELCSYGSSSGSGSVSAFTNDGPQFPWFATKGTSASAVKSTLANMSLTNSGALPSGVTGSDVRFHTRSVYPNITDDFVSVKIDGSAANTGAYSAYGSYTNSVLPCFSI